MVVKGSFFLLCVVAVVMASEKKEAYTDKYDNFDMEELKNNRKLLMGYARCILDKGPCTAEGKELKTNMREAIQTGCEKCTETQKSKSNDMIQHLMKNESEIWNELCAKYDPEGKWRKKYEEEAKAAGIEIPQ